MISVRLDTEHAESLVLVLDHVISQAEGTASSAYGIDTLCRKDSARRWHAIRALIRSKLNPPSEK